MIDKGRFYCVSCQKILPVPYSLQDQDGTDGNLPYIFRTGFYRSEISLGCCQHCMRASHPSPVHESVLSGGSHEAHSPTHRSFVCNEESEL
ncbi:hypothetical protein Q5741_12405 [Paenibacillus sp. JX-17]|uniref:Uncharacterized protein n=1 Tax=Paenibacillus lacisoli TaxID=3064525 RepID=A0ABT9CH01_9BACL|nr:hypothetical protein [Paenibacillus sp. JX-17]MDO7907212.1 hypothetical protein [Paenibacillus sp. JX-17]